MKLTAAKRRRIPKSEFAVPGKAPGSGSFPIPDKSHARAALRLIGHASPEERPTIRAKANRMLGKGDAFTKARAVMDRARGK